MQVKWRCARDRVSAVRPHHETNDDGEGGGMRKGDDDETEGETKAECERTVEYERGTREKRTKRGEDIAENRVEAGKAGKADKGKKN